MEYTFTLNFASRELPPISVRDNINRPDDLDLDLLTSGY